MEVNALRNEKQELMRENREKSVLLGHYKANAPLRVRVEGEGRGGEGRGGEGRGGEGRGGKGREGKGIG